MMALCQPKAADDDTLAMVRAMVCKFPFPLLLFVVSFCAGEGWAFLLMLMMVMVMVLVMVLLAWLVCLFVCSFLLHGHFRCVGRLCFCFFSNA